MLVSHEHVHFRIHKYTTNEQQKQEKKTFILLLMGFSVQGHWVTFSQWENAQVDFLRSSMFKLVFNDDFY